MNIIVCLKRVPDTGAQIEIDGLSIKEQGLSWVMNPYDEFAVEEAVRIKEGHGATVTLLTMDAGGAGEALKKAVAMGADQAVCVKGARTDDPDGLKTARALAAAIKTLPFDLILCGKQGTDLDRGMVGPALACLLDIPVISAIKKLELFPQESRAVARREVEGGVEVVECALPALLTAQKGLNEPRYPSLPGIMKAKKHEIKYIEAAAPGAEAGPAFKREALAYPAMERKNIRIEGDAGECAAGLAKVLKQEVKVI